MYRPAFNDVASMVRYAPFRGLVWVSTTAAGYVAQYYRGGACCGGWQPYSEAAVRRVGVHRQARLLDGICAGRQQREHAGRHALVLLGHALRELLVISVDNGVVVEDERVLIVGGVGCGAPVVRAHKKGGVRGGVASIHQQLFVVENIAGAGFLQKACSHALAEGAEALPLVSP
jgi:hypothetical protein